MKKVNVIELVRLVRKESIKAPLSWLISKTIKALKRKGGYDIAISYADATQKHHGGIYQACSWNFHAYRKPGEDGLIIDGEFVPRRSVSTRFGTYAKGKLGAMFDEVKDDPGILAFAGEKEKVKTIEWTEHIDQGKYLYWIPLNKKGKHIAIKELDFENNVYPKPEKESCQQVTKN